MTIVNLQALTDWTIHWVNWLTETWILMYEPVFHGMAQALHFLYYKENTLEFTGATPRPVSLFTTNAVATHDVIVSGKVWCNEVCPSALK